MAAKDKRIQVRVDDDIEVMVRDLAEHWSPIGEPMKQSVVFRECVRRVHGAEIKPGKPARSRS